MSRSITDGEVFVNTHREGKVSRPVDNCGMDFAANLRALRGLRGMTQEALAAACGWDNATRITNYESRSENPRNRRKPDLEDIPVLARALGVGVGVLLSETPPESPEELGPSSLSKRLDPRIIEHATVMAQTMLGKAPFDPFKDVPLFISAYELVADATVENRARFDAALTERVIATNGGGSERSADSGSRPGK